MKATIELFLSDEPFGSCSSDIGMVMNVELPMTPTRGLVITDSESEYNVRMVSFDIPSGRLYVYLDVERFIDRAELEARVISLQQVGWTKE
jgi:hypothetical protein